MLLKTHQYLICIKKYIPAIHTIRIFTLAVFLIYMNTQLFAAENDGGGSPLMDFIWKVVNVVVLGAIIYKFAKKPVGNALSSSAKTAKKLIIDAR